MSRLKQKANENVETKLLYLNMMIWDVKKQDFVYLFHGKNTAEFARINQYRYALYNQSIQVSGIVQPPYYLYDNVTQEWTGLAGDIWHLAEEYLNFRYYLYMRLPESSGNPLFIIRTLKPYVWAATSLMLFVIGICFWLTTHVLGDLNLEKYRRLSPLTCILMVHAGLLGQTVWLTPQRYSIRAHIFTSMLFGYTIYTTISALLVAELSVKDLQIPFTSIREVIENQVSLCVRPGSWAHATLEKRTINQAKLKKSINGPGCPAKDHVSVVEAICDHGVVLLESETVMVSLSQEPWTCRILVWGRDPRLPRLSNSFIFSKGFLQRRAVYHFLERLRGTGILTYLQDKWVPDLVRGLKRPQYSQVEFNHIRGILMMYTFFVIMSVFILIIERCVYKYKLRQM